MNHIYIMKRMPTTVLDYISSSIYHNEAIVQLKSINFK